MEDAFVSAIQEGWGRAPTFEDRFAPMISAIFDKIAEISDVMPLHAMTKDMVGATSYTPNKRMIETIAQLYAQGVDAGAFRPIPPDI